MSALTDSAGTAQTLYSYEPYGETSASGPAPNTAKPWKYTSGYLDSTGFYKMGMRYYRPELMRWSQQDPKEQPTDALQANRYGYAGGNPISHADPSGTDIFDDAENAWNDFTDTVDNISLEEAGGLFLSYAGTAGFCTLATGSAVIPGGQAATAAAAPACAASYAGSYYSTEQALQSEN